MPEMSLLEVLRVLFVRLLLLMMLVLSGVPLVQVDQVVDLELLWTFQGVVRLVHRDLILLPLQDLVLLLLELEEFPVLLRGVKTAVSTFLAVHQTLNTLLMLAFQEL